MFIFSETVFRDKKAVSQVDKAGFEKNLQMLWSVQLPVQHIHFFYH
jgi:hypothetical protein